MIKVQCQTLKLFLSFFFLFLLSFGVISAQRLPADTLISRMHYQTKIFPQEKLYIHTDRAAYAGGEKIWMRAYVANAISLKPEHLSRYVYAELIDPEGNLTDRVRMRQNETGSIEGCLELSDTLIAGQYTLRGYTRYMENAGDEYFFKKRIRVMSTLGKSIRISPEWGEQGKVKLTLINPANNEAANVGNVNLFAGNDKVVSSFKDGEVKADISFFTRNNKNLMVQAGNYKEYIPIPKIADFAVSFLPEGGNLVAGELCKIAFKALSEDGSECNVSGEIRDEKGLIVSTFSSLHRGMGTFSFIPLEGKSYKVVCKNTEGKVKTFALPAADAASLSLKIDNLKENLLLKVLHASSASAVDSVWVIAHQGGNPLYVHLHGINEAINFRKSDFDAGIIHFMTASRSLAVLSERLVFNYPVSELIIAQVLSDKQHYDPHEKVLLSLVFQDYDGKMLNGTCSMAVTADTDILPDSAVSILSSLLLTSELKGFVESPHWYFTAGSEKLKAEALDVLMLTQGWRRYDLPKVMQADYRHPRVMPETGMELSGRVVSSVLRKPIGNTRVGVSIPQFGVVEQLETDDDGYFKFKDFEFPDTTRYLVSAVSKRGKENVELQINREQFPADKIQIPFLSTPLSAAGDHASDSVFPQNYLQKADLQLFYEKGIRNILMDELVVTAPARIYKTPMEPYVDITIREEKLKKRELFSLGESVGSLNLPGVFYSDGQLRFRGGPVKLVIDEVPIDEKENKYFLENLRVADIMQIDFNRMEAVLGISPVLYITLKKGITGGYTYPTLSNISVVELLGYQHPAAFYSPQYDKAKPEKPDLRTTIYWNPNIIIKDGKGNVKFYAADDKVDYSIVVEGLTDEGKIIRIQKKLP